MDYYKNYYCDLAKTPAQYKEGLKYRYELNEEEIKKAEGPNVPDTQNPKAVYDPWVNCFCSVTVIAVGGMVSFVTLWVLHYFKAFGVKPFVGPKK